MWLAAGSSSPISVNWTQLIQYGVLGLVVLGAIMGFVWFKPAVDKIIEERDAERAYSKELETELRQQIIPLLSSVQNSTVEAIKVINEVKGALDVGARPRRSS